MIYKIKSFVETSRKKVKNRTVSWQI